jgi:hypothetical protein
MTPEEKDKTLRDKTLREMDAILERAERTCEEYQLIQMEMMAALARAKAIHKRLLAKRAELERELGESGRSVTGS